MKGIGAGLKSIPSTGQGVVLTCPMDAPFLPNLAAAIISGSIWNRGAPEPHELPALTIYLPVHAAVEPLKLAFLKLAPDGATFLPRIRVLGDADPLDLFAAFGTRMASTPAALGLLERALAIPPAFEELERQVQLAALCAAASQSLRSAKLAAGALLYTAMPAPSAFAVAGEIAALIAEAFTEGAGLSRIMLLDSSYSSGGEQLSMQLLRKVFRGWQAHKVKAGKIDREERRNELMAIETEFIRQSDAPVIIAGSTGSVAATAGLMQAALARPQSALVLYGLDGTQTRESFAALAAHPEHPQHGLQHLLARLDIGWQDIRPLPAAEKVRERETALRRVKFIGEAMRPAPATAGWAPYIQSLKLETASPAPGLSLLEAETIQEETAAIALILRECLETGGQFAALVTPSETILNRVRHALAKWGLGSEGAPGGMGGEDDLASRALACAASEGCEEFVELIRHAQTHDLPQAARMAEMIDLGVLRQMWRPRNFAGIEAALSRAEHAVSSGEARHSAMKRIAREEWEAARRLTAGITAALSPLTVAAQRQLALQDWIAHHRSVLAGLFRLGFPKAAPDSGEGALLSRLERAGDCQLICDLAAYAGLFQQAMLTKRAAAVQNPHPRIFLLSPLDARLQTADLVILAGLNEGCWPATPKPSPWLSRRDRDFVGLPPQERRAGQTAHDFVALAASAPRVILTRSKKENGSLARPSRYVSRIKALAKGAGKLDALEASQPWLAWAAAYRVPAAVIPAPRPEPRPPLAARPRRLSVTAIETWFANPYAIYARHILGLEPLRGAGEASDARDKGILYHAALHKFFKAHPSALPDNAASVLLRKLDEAAAELGFNLESAPFWRPRFARFAAWFAGAETGLRAGVEMLKSEVGGKLRVEAPRGPFEITARADRIDGVAGGGLRIYDFKTSANTAKISAGRGAPQLALEGLLAREGAFAGLPAGASAELFYVIATGGEPAGEIVTLTLPAEKIDAAAAGTLARIALFDDPATAYSYETRAIFRDKSEHDPYAHLARVQEWAGMIEDAEDGDD